MKTVVVNKRRNPIKFICGSYSSYLILDSAENSKCIDVFGVLHFIRKNSLVQSVRLINFPYLYQSIEKRIIYIYIIYKYCNKSVHIYGEMSLNGIFV